MSVRLTAFAKATAVRRSFLRQAKRGRTPFSPDVVRKRGTAPFPLRVTVLERGGGARAGAGLGRWLALLAPRRARGRVTVAIAPDRIVRALNRRFRGKNRPTDVLSFPGEGDWLGDIVIARGIARGQAREGGHRMAVEVRILALHGLLHLLGYDHETDDGRMARLEERLRRLGGLP